MAVLVTAFYYAKALYKQIYRRTNKKEINDGILLYGAKNSLF